MAVADRYCGSCGERLGPEDRSCPGCGQPTHETADAPKLMGAFRTHKPPLGRGESGGMGRRRT